MTGGEIYDFGPFPVISSRSIMEDGPSTDYLEMVVWLVEVTSRAREDTD